MAKENMVLMYGYIEKLEKEQLETGRDGGLRITLKTIRNYERYDYPIIYTQDWELIRKFTNDDIKEGDMLSIKGTLRSIMDENGSVETVVNMLWAHKMEEQVDETTAEILLNKNAEISNNIFILGTVCKKPRYLDDDENGRKAMFQFQIASNRKRKLVGDDPENRTDYLWVKAFGKLATQMNNALNVKSEIFISGSVQTRMVTKETIDPETGKFITIEKKVTEIIPFSVEFLRNCNLYSKETDVEEILKIIEKKEKALQERETELNQTECMVRRLCQKILGTDILLEGDDINALVRKACGKVCC